MKKIIITSNINCGNIFDKCLDTQKAYADKFGWEHKVYTEFQDGDENIPYKTARDDKKAAWTKLSRMDELLLEYDLVLWLDADIQCRDTAPNIEIELEDGKEIYMAKENDGRFNAGVILCKCGQASGIWLEKMLANSGNKVPEDFMTKYENGHVWYYAQEYPTSLYVKELSKSWNSKAKVNYFNHCFGLLTYNSSDKDLDKLYKEHYFKPVLNEHLESFKDLHKGKTGFLLGNGPTAEEFHKHANDIAKSEKNILFATNGTIYTDIKADYLVCSDPPRKVDGVKTWDKFKAEQDLYARFPMCFFKDYIKEYCELPNVQYYKSNIDQFRILRGEAVGSGYSDDVSIDIGSNVSVAHDMIQIMLYMGLKKIYIVGCDCGVSGFEEDDPNWMGDISIRKAEQLIKCWELCKKFTDSKYPKVDIKVVNPVNLKVYEGVKLEDII